MVSCFDKCRGDLIKHFSRYPIRSPGFFLAILVLMGCSLDDPSPPPVFPELPPPPGAFATTPVPPSQPGSSSASISSCSQSGVIFCDPGTYLGGFTATIPQFRGSSGFLQYNITGIFLEGKVQDNSVAFLADPSDPSFAGPNWIYLKGVDVSPSGLPPGAWKIKCRAQGTNNEGPFMGSNNFDPNQTYVVRVEWGNRRVQALVDGEVITSANLLADVVFNGLSLWINETPRSNLEPPYPGAVISNILVGQ